MISAGAFDLRQKHYGESVEDVASVPYAILGAMTSEPERTPL